MPAKKLQVVNNDHSLTTMPPHESASKPKRKAQDEPLQNPKSQRASRYNGMSPYNFDLKYHKDYDPSMKPKANATKRAAASQRKTSNLPFVVATMKSTKTLSEDANDTGNEDRELRSGAATRRTLSTLNDSHALRRSSRDSLLKNGPHSYNAKWHPGDDSKAFGLRRTSLFVDRKVARSSPTSPGSPELPSQNLEEEQASPAAELSALDLAGDRPPHSLSRGLLEPLTPYMLPPNGTSSHLKWKSLDWTRLSDFERALFLLGKGAPVEGDQFPVEWSVVKETLFEQGFQITLDFVNSLEGTEALKRRYETLRLGIEAFFTDRPESMNEDGLTLRRIENFDVYDLERGVRCGEHLQHGTIQPIETNSKPTARVTGNEVNCVTDTENKKSLASAADPASTSLTILASQHVSIDPIEDRPNDTENATTHDDLISPEESERRLVDLMGTDQRVASQGLDEIKGPELDALLNGADVGQIRDTQKNIPSNITTRPVEGKRGKRPVAADFWDVEDNEDHISEPRPDVLKRNSSRPDPLHAGEMSLRELVSSTQNKPPFKRSRGLKSARSVPVYDSNGILHYRREYLHKESTVL